MLKNKRLLMYLFVLIVLICMPFITWYLDFNFTFDAFKVTISETVFNEQFIHLTFGNMQYIVLLLPLIISFFSLKDYYALSKNKVSRKEYFNIVKQNTFLYPLYIIMMLIISLVLFDKTGGLSVNLIGIGNVNVVLAVLLSILLSLVFEIIVINIALIFANISKDFKFSFIFSYIVLIVYTILSETLLGNLFSKILSLEGVSDAFNLFNLLTLSGNIYVLLVYGILVTIITKVIFKYISNKHN